MKKHRFSAAIVLSLMIVFTLLAGCGRSTSSDSDSDSRTTLTHESSITDTPVSDGASPTDDRGSDESYVVASNTPPEDLEETPASDFKYEYDAGTQGIRIIKYIGTSIRVRIPDEIEGEPVTVIGKEAFRNSGIKYVYLPNSIIIISEFAFSRCEGLTDIIIPNSVIEIRGGDSASSGAFSYCSALNRIEIPGSVKELGANTFSECHGLNEVIIQNGVERIGDWAFWGCDNLNSIEIPDSVTEIGMFAFDDCISLTDINLPDSITMIGAYSFAGSGLTAIHLPVSLNMIGEEAFKDCTNLTDIEISCDMSSVYLVTAFGEKWSIKSGNDIFRGCPLSEEAKQLILTYYPDTDFGWLE